MSYKEGDEIKKIVKCKGFTLKNSNAVLNAESMAALVKKGSQTDYLLTDKVMQIKRNLLKQSLYIDHLNKRFRITGRKRLFVSSGISYPYGYDLR